MYVIVVPITIIVISVIGLIKWQQSYWSRRGLPYLEPEFLFGNIKDSLLGKEQITFPIKRMYEQMKRKKWRHGGVYFLTTPVYLPIDIEILKNIMIKDFQYFTDRSLYHNKNDSFHSLLINMKGNAWHRLRTKLTPPFSSSKTKMMFNSMLECEKSLLQRMDVEFEKSEVIDIGEILACFSINIIGSCAFGLDCNALEEENSDFRRLGKMIFAPSKWNQIKAIVSNYFPNICEFFDVRLSEKKVVDFSRRFVRSIIDYRETNNVMRNDFIQQMINLKNKIPKNNSSDEQPLSFNELTAQCILFFAAGYETTSTLLTCTLYELAKNLDIQVRLRGDINRVLSKHNNEITYDSIKQMTYLNQVIEETLRMHPPVGLVDRVCVKDYKLPNDNFIIEKGTQVIIPILAVHYDETYYPNPTKFDPERFSTENRQNILPCTQLGFGEGPRNCIGMSLARLELQICIVSLLRNYKFDMHSKTPETISHSKGGFLLSIADAMWLKVSKIYSN